MQTLTFRGLQRKGKAFALTEMLIAMGVAAVVFLVICAFSMFCGRSFAAMFNYVDLDDSNRVAIDQMTRDVRHANRVSYYSTNRMAMSLEDGDGTTISYVYNPTARTLVRTRGSEVKVVLKQCDQLEFKLGQRNTDQGGYDVFDAVSDVTIAKVVNVSWVCSRSIFGRKENTESVQTARIVIRKQGST